MPKLPFYSLPLLLVVLLACIAAAPAAAPAPTTAPALTPSQASSATSEALTQCLALQGKLFSQTSALAELKAQTQFASGQRDLERARHEAQLQALKAENDRLLYIAIISALILMLVVAAGFGVYLRKRHQQLRKLSEVDQLTGLNNRHAATVILNQLTAQRGAEGTRHVLFLIDIDHFKQINDTYGHHAGDEVLVEMAKRLKTACRPTDLVARWGGEEFLVACPNLTREQAEQIACRLRSCMAYTLEAAHSKREITVSLGLAPIPFFETPSDNVAAHRWDYALRMADTALYAAKRTRDAWTGYWGAQLPDEATAEAALEQPEAAKGLITVMSSIPSVIPMPNVRTRSVAVRNEPEHLLETA